MLLSDVVIALCTISATAATLGGKPSAAPLHEIFTSSEQFQNAAAMAAASRRISDAAQLQFYGKVVNTNSVNATANFTGILSSGMSTFDNNSSDFANIYDSHDDYDTWRQSVSGQTMGNYTGSFTYQYANTSNGDGAIGNTLGTICLVLEVSWLVGFPSAAPSPPVYDCNARVLALEYDCHTSWGVSTECTYDGNQVAAVFSVVNLGPDGLPPLDTASLARGGGSQRSPRGSVVLVKRRGSDAIEAEIAVLQE